MFATHTPTLDVFSCWIPEPDERLGWRVYMQRFHRLGDRPMVGEHLMYAALLGAVRCRVFEGVCGLKALRRRGLRRYHSCAIHWARRARKIRLRAIFSERTASNWARLASSAMKRSAYAPIYEENKLSKLLGVSC